MAVAVNAPAVFARRRTSPARHLEAAALLGADARGAAPGDAGALLAAQVRELARAIAEPASIAAVGYTRRRRRRPRRRHAAAAAPARERAGRDRRRVPARAVHGALLLTDRPTLDALSVRHRDHDAVDGQRRLRPRQQRRLLQLLRQRGEPLPDRARRPRHRRVAGDRRRRRVAVHVPRAARLPAGAARRRARRQARQPRRSPTASRSSAAATRRPRRTASSCTCSSIARRARRRRSPTRCAPRSRRSRLVSCAPCGCADTRRAQAGATTRVSRGTADAPASPREVR